MLHSQVFSDLMSEQVRSEALLRLGWGQRVPVWAHHCNLCSSCLVLVRFCAAWILPSSARKELVF